MDLTVLDRSQLKSLIFAAELGLLLSFILLVSDAFHFLPS